MKWVGLLLLLVATVSYRAESITVSAAASLKDVLLEVAKRYDGAEVKLNLGASGQLAAQIEAGAPVDVFVSAAVEPVDRLVKEKLVIAETKKIIAGNRLVLIAMRDSKVNKLEDLATVEHVAIGDPRTVPAGQYAKQSLTKLGWWDRLSKKFVYGMNVRQVLDYVEHGEAEAGFVYATDVRPSPLPSSGVSGEGVRVRVVMELPEKTHEPIVYVAVVAKGKNEEAAGKFVKYLTSEDARGVFKKFGFTVP